MKSKSFRQISQGGPATCRPDRVASRSLTISIQNKDNVPEPITMVLLPVPSAPNYTWSGHLNCYQLKR